MNNKVLIDTDILSEIGKGIDQNVVRTVTKARAWSRNENKANTTGDER